MSIVQEPRAKPKYEAFLDSRLDSAAVQVRWADIGVGAIGLFAFTLAYGLVMVLADRWLHLPAIARQLGLVAFIAGAVWYIRRVLLTPIRSQVNPYYAARKVEHVMPEAKNSLVNWLDLRDRPLAEPIRDALGRKAAGDLSHANLNEAIKDRRLSRSGAVAGMLTVTLIVVLAILRPTQFFSLVERTFLPFTSTAIAAQTQITLVEPKGGDVAVPVHHSVTMRVEVDGRLPKADSADALRLRMRYQAGDPVWEERKLEQSDRPSEWMTRVASAQVRTGFEYQIVGGDAATPIYKVRVIAKPLVSDFEVTYKYRPYLHYTDDVRADPNLSAVHGTQVTLLAKTNRQVRAGILKFTPNEGAPPPPLAAEMMPARPDTLKFVFPLDQSGKYRLQFTAADGEPSDETLPFDINVLPDLPPKVEITKKAAERAAPNGILFINGRATDDFGLTKARLVFRMYGAEGATPEPLQPVACAEKLLARTDGKFPRLLELKEAVPLDSLRDAAGAKVTWQPKMQIEYAFEVEDNYDNPSPQLGRSKFEKVTIGEPLPPQEQKQQQEAADKVKQEQQQEQPQENPADQQKPGQAKPDEHPKDKGEQQPQDKDQSQSQEQNQQQKPLTPEEKQTLDAAKNLDNAIRDAEQNPLPPQANPPQQQNPQPPQNQQPQQPQQPHNKPQQQQKEKIPNQPQDKSGKTGGQSQPQNQPQGNENSGEQSGTGQQQKPNANQQQPPGQSNQRQQKPDGSGAQGNQQNKPDNKQNQSPQQKGTDNQPKPGGEGDQQKSGNEQKQSPKEKGDNQKGNQEKSGNEQKQHPENGGNDNQSKSGSQPGEQKNQPGTDPKQSNTQQKPGDGAKQAEQKQGDKPGEGNQQAGQPQSKDGNKPSEGQKGNQPQTKGKEPNGDKSDQQSAEKGRPKPDQQKGENGNPGQPKSENGQPKADQQKGEGGKQEPGNQGQPTGDQQKGENGQPKADGSQPKSDSGQPKADVKQPSEGQSADRKDKTDRTGEQPGQRQGTKPNDQDPKTSPGKGQAEGGKGSSERGGQKPNGEKNTKAEKEAKSGASDPNAKPGDKQKSDTPHAEGGQGNPNEKREPGTDSKGAKPDTSKSNEPGKREDMPAGTKGEKREGSGKPKPEDIQKMIDDYKKADPHTKKQITDKLADKAKNGSTPQEREAAQEAMEECRGEETSKAGNKPKDNAQTKPGEKVSPDKPGSAPNDQTQEQGKPGEKVDPTKQPKPGEDPNAQPNDQHKGEGEPKKGDQQNGEADNQSKPESGKPKDESGEQNGKQPGPGKAGGDQPGDIDPTPGEGLADPNKNFLAKSGDLQLENFRKKVDRKVLDKAKMSEAEYQEFLKAYEKLVQKTKEEAKAQPGDRVRGEAKGSSAANSGAKKVEGQANGPKVDRGNRGQAPADVRDQYREFTEKQSKEEKK
ncbi:MAG: DUF4175 family protein [Gemmataceae bacterium]